MPFQRKTASVIKYKAKYQSSKKTNPAKGIYSWDLIWIDESGDRHQKTIRGTEDDANSEAFAISLRLQKILKLGPDEYEEMQKRATPLEDSPEIFWEAKKKEGRSNVTKKILGYGWRYFVEANQNDSLFRRSKERGTVASLSPKHLRNFVEYLRSNSFGYDGKTSISPFTQGKYYRHIKASLKWLHENDYIEKDPTRGVKGPALPTINVTSLTPEQVQYALEKTSEHQRGDEIYALILAYLYLGCRASELLPPFLTWDRFHGHTIERPNLKQKKAEVEWMTVSLVGDDGEVLREILEERLKNKDKWVIRNGKGNPVKDRNGNVTSAPFPYTYWQVRRLLSYDFFPDIGLKGTNLQMLRDSAATLRQLSGQPLSVVSMLLGHSNPSVTMKYYTDKVQMLGSVAGSLNITSRQREISNTLPSEAIGKNEISNSFQLSQEQKKSPQKEGFLDKKVDVARAGIEPATQGFSVPCSTD